MRLDQHRDALTVAVVLALLLGVVTAIYLHEFPPQPDLVSCTIATACDTPHRDDPYVDRPFPPYQQPARTPA